MQCDLFPAPELQVQAPEGSTAPRLWVRRLVIWSEPGVVLRDIALHPGLNIIWSPDPSDLGAKEDSSNAPSGPGHGAGKSLVCRLLRYCLGEQNFAPETQRAKISSAFKDGCVGAEVVIDGVTWAVIRSIGPVPRDTVHENATLDDAFAENVAHTGMAPFIQAICRQIVTPEVAEVFADDPERAWLLALAWLARDQECRFERVTDWRAASSESGSPARRLSVGDATTIVRALLGAISPSESRLESEIEDLSKQRDGLARVRERQGWMISQFTARIKKAVGLRRRSLPQGSLLVPFLRNAAREQLARVSIVNPTGDPASLEELEAMHEEVRDEVQQLERKMEAAKSSRRTAEVVAKLIASETPGLSAIIYDAELPTCPTCEVPIDRALADGCKLSSKIPDLKTLRMRRERNEEKLRAQQVEIEQADAISLKLAPELKSAEERRSKSWESVVAARRLNNERSKAWYVAGRVSDDIAELEKWIKSQAATESRIERIEATLRSKREDVGSERDRHIQVFAQFGRIFDPLVRRLIGADAKGRVYHDGNGLHLTIEYGGERSTPAIDSVKVISFDLATMCRSIEGGTWLPALLIHDSPREADLGLSIYHEIFRFIVDLEKIGSSPLFQYIITTTTRPPEELAVEPWVRLKLNGAPANARLLRRDL